MESTALEHLLGSCGKPSGDTVLLSKQGGQAVLGTRIQPQRASYSMHCRNACSGSKGAEKVKAHWLDSRTSLMDDLPSL